MSAHDERLDYYLMVTRLMAEAGAQLEADARERESIPYAEDLEILREAIQTAEAAAAKIVLGLITSRRAGLATEREADPATARH